MSARNPLPLFCKMCVTGSQFRRQMPGLPLLEGSETETIDLHVAFAIHVVFGKSD